MSLHQRAGSPDPFEIGFGTIAATAAILLALTALVPALLDYTAIALIPFGAAVILWLISHQVD